MKTVNKYSQRVAIVQSGWKTQGVSYVSLYFPACGSSVFVVIGKEFGLLV